MADLLVSVALYDRHLLVVLPDQLVVLELLADDVLPHFRSPFAKLISGLLKEELVSFVGTDAHKDTERSPEMLRCWQYLIRKCDPDYVREITRENTLRIIRNEEV